MSPFQLPYLGVLLPILSIVNSLASAIPFESSNVGHNLRQLSGRTGFLTPANILGVDHAFLPKTAIHGRVEKRDEYRTSTSISHPAPNSLFPRSFASLKGRAFRVLEMTVITPTTQALHGLKRRVDDTFARFDRYVKAIQSFAPRSHFTLRLGSVQMEFWSPAIIPWVLVTSVIQTYMLIGMMWYAVLGKVVWLYATAAAIWVTLRLGPQFGDRIIGI